MSFVVHCPEIWGRSIRHVVGLCVEVDETTVLGKILNRYPQLLKKLAVS